MSLAGAIRNRNGKNAIIAEIKCASPSRGVIRRNVDMAMMAGVLKEGGCVALSVLTEPYFFGGTGRDIEQVKSAVSLPVLRKDFIIDERQIAESRALGADAVLLIAAVLGKKLPDYVDSVFESWSGTTRGSPHHGGSRICPCNKNYPDRYQQPRSDYTQHRPFHNAAHIRTGPS